MICSHEPVGGPSAVCGAYNDDDDDVDDVASHGQIGVPLFIIVHYWWVFRH